MKVSAQVLKLIDEIQRLEHGEFAPCFVPFGEKLYDLEPKGFKKLIAVLDRYQELECLKIQDGLPVFCEVAVESDFGNCLKKIKLS